MLFQPFGLTSEDVMVWVVTEKVERQVIQQRKRTPGFSAERLKNDFEIPASVGAISRILKGTWLSLSGAIVANLHRRSTENAEGAEYNA